MSSKKQHRTPSDSSPRPNTPTRDEKFRNFAARYGALFLALLAIVGGVTNISPAWAAHNGNGIRGTWTATARQCGTKSCHLVGWFVPATTIGTATPTVFDAQIADGSHSSKVGDSESAIDVAGRIYPADGGWDWITFSLALVAGTAGLGLWIRFAVHRFRHRRTD